MMISRKPWGIEGVARLCLAIIATLCVGMLLAASLGKVHLGLAKGQIEFLQMMISLAFFQVSTLVWITLFLRQYGTGWKEAFGLGLSEPFTAAAYGILAGALFLPAAWVLQFLSEMLMELAHLTPEAQAAVQAFWTRVSRWGASWRLERRPLFWPRWRKRRFSGASFTPRSSSKAIRALPCGALRGFSR